MKKVLNYDIGTEHSQRKAHQKKKKTLQHKNHKNRAQKYL